MAQGCFGGHGSHGIEHRRQHFVLHLNQPKCFQGGLLIQGCNGGHFLADETDLVCG